jgi:hypothetical protein
MLYLFATGQLPFTASNTTATLKRILDCTYDDPRQLAPAVSDELAEIVSRCLSRAPSSRYPTAGQLRDALMAYLEPLGLSRPHEELQRFFAGPSAYRKALLPGLVERVLARAERYLSENRPAKALSCLNHALALEPGNGRARSLLDAMHQARRRQRRSALVRRTVLWGTLGAAGLGAGAYALAHRPPPPLPEVDQLATPLPAPGVPAPAEVPAHPAASQGAIMSVGPAPVAVEKARPSPPPSGPAAPARVAVSIQVRPFAYVQVDDGPRSQEALAEHRLQLSPGEHRVTLTCQVCEPSTETVTVPAAPTDEPIRLVARPLPAQLVFDVDAPDATVRIGAEERPARDTAAAPFQVSIPRGSFQNPVEYTVRAPGYQPVTGRVMAKAGERLPVTAKLSQP